MARKNLSPVDDVSWIIGMFRVMIRTPMPADVPRLIQPRHLCISYISDWALATMTPICTSLKVCRLVRDGGAHGEGRCRRHLDDADPKVRGGADEDHEEQIFQRGRWELILGE